MLSQSEDDFSSEHKTDACDDASGHGQEQITEPCETNVHVNGVTLGGVTADDILLPNHQSQSTTPCYIRDKSELVKIIDHLSCTPNITGEISASDHSVSLDADYYDSDTPNTSNTTPVGRCQQSEQKIQVRSSTYKAEVDDEIGEMHQSGHSVVSVDSVLRPIDEEFIDNDTSTEDSTDEDEDEPLDLYLPSSQEVSVTDGQITAKINRIESILISQAEEQSPASIPCVTSDVDELPEPGSPVFQATTPSGTDQQVDVTRSEGLMEPIEEERSDTETSSSGEEEEGSESKTSGVYQIRPSDSLEYIAELPEDEITVEQKLANFNPSTEAAVVFGKEVEVSSDNVYEQMNKIGTLASITRENSMLSESESKREINFTAVRCEIEEDYRVEDHESILPEDKTESDTLQILCENYTTVAERTFASENVEETGTDPVSEKEGETAERLLTTKEPLFPSERSEATIEAALSTEVIQGATGERTCDVEEHYPNDDEASENICTSCRISAIDCTNKGTSYVSEFVTSEDITEKTDPIVNQHTDEAVNSMEKEPELNALDDNSREPTLSPEKHH